MVLAPARKRSGKIAQSKPTEPKSHGGEQSRVEVNELRAPWRTGQYQLQLASERLQAVNIEPVGRDAEGGKEDNKEVGGGSTASQQGLTRPSMAPGTQGIQ